MEIKELVKAYHAAYDAGELDRIEQEYIHPDMIWHFMGMPDITGRDAVMATFKTFYAACGNGKHTLYDILTENDKAATRFRFDSVHQGEFMGVPATGKTFSIEGTVIDRFSENKLIERWTIINTLGVLQQLGALPTK